jgi:hypothetical protein
MLSSLAGLETRAIFVSKSSALGVHQTKETFVILKNVCDNKG